MSENMEILLGSLQEKLELDDLFDETRHDDYFLTRFLTARNFKLKDAYEMIVKYEEWRKTEGVEDIVNNFAFPEAADLAKVYPRYYHKIDKEGHSVYIQQFNNIDFNLVLGQITTIERLGKYAIRDLEKLMRYRLEACSIKKGEKLHRGTIIMDIKGAPLTQFQKIRAVIENVSAVSSNYYPETLSKMFIINAPALFTAVWKIIKGFLDERTSSKIEILGSNYEKKLLETIDADNLPSYLGGNCNCPGGCQNSDIGPWNDGTVPGYPIAFWEDMKVRDAIN